MPDETRYVALKRLTFGDEVLEPGDEVPIEEGRNYRQMLRLGQIAAASTLAASGPPSEGALCLTVRPGQSAVFLSGDGTLHTVAFLGLEAPPEEALEGLGIEPGSPEAQRAALVSFPDAPDEAVFVRADQLLTEGQARQVQVLIDQHRKDQSRAEGEVERLKVALAAAEESQSRATVSNASSGAEKGAKAAAPTPLPHNFVARGKLEKAGITSYEQLSGKTADQLNAIEGVTAEVAAKILAAYQAWADKPGE